VWLTSGSGVPPRPEGLGPRLANSAATAPRRCAGSAAIATALGVSERAVEKHTNSIFTKLGLSEEKDLNRRVKAVLLFLSEGRGG